MNQALQAQLEKLGRTLAIRNNQSAALFELPDKRLMPPPVIPLRAAESPVEAAETVFRKGDAMPLQETLESFSARQVARLPPEIRPLARRIYACLHRLGCHVVHIRGYPAKTSQVSYFCPTEAIWAHLGISEGSFYRSLKELHIHGLVASRGHKTTLNNRTRCDGTLWAVKLFPKRGSRARLHFEDLKATYRDLEADIKAGNTVYRQMRGSSGRGYNQVEFEVLTSWALSEPLKKNPVTMTLASGPGLKLEILLDVPHLPRQGRRGGVDRAARALCHHLADHGSLDFYRYLVWQLLRLDQQGRGYFWTVYTMVLRVKADMTEKFARKPGALFVSRLKACSLWDEIREVPSVQASA